MKKIIGYAAVDSGQLIVVDPCYLRSWKDGEADNAGSHYGQSCKATLSEEQGGEVLVSGSAGTGVAFSTGWGDGSYPVEAEYEAGRVKSIRIKFF